MAYSKSPLGPWKFLHSVQPDGLSSLDLNIFRDQYDNVTFFIRSVDNEYVGISILDHTGIKTKGGLVSTYRPCLEGMVLFRDLDGTWFALFSHLTVRVTCVMCDM